MKLNNVKLYALIKTRRYSDLRKEMYVDEKNNIYVSQYIYELLNTDKDVKKKRGEIKRLIGALNHTFVPCMLDGLVENNLYDNYWLKDVLLDEHIVINQKEKYIKAFIKELVAKVRMVDIIKLYAMKSTTNDEKKIIIESIMKLINEKPKLASGLAYYQHVYKTIIIPTYYLQDIAIATKDAQGMYEIMECEDSERKTLLKELGKIKDKSFNNKSVFLLAAIRYFPKVVSSVPFGNLIEMINSEPTCNFIKKGILELAENKVLLFKTATKKDEEEQSQEKYYDAIELLDKKDSVFVKKNQQH